MTKKIGFYLLSLWLFFVLIIITTIDIPVYFSADNHFVGIVYLLKNNVIPIISLICIASGVVSYYWFKHILKGTKNLAFTIKEVEDVNYEHLSFLVTYIVPLVCINVDTLRSKVILFCLLISIAAIYVRTDMFYVNPTLALLGFRIYKITGCFRDGSEREGIIVITKDVLEDGYKVKYIKLDKRIYYGVKTNEKK